MLEIVTVIGTAMTEIETVLSAYTRKFNQNLEPYFPVSEAPEQKAVAAMRYSILNGGKRLRPFLLHETAGLFGVDYETAFSSVGINQINYKIWLAVHLELRIVNPLYREDITLERKIMLADLVFSGKVPAHYFQISRPNEYLLTE